MSELSLRFLSGRLQGTELPFKGRSQIVVGRGEEADLMVSDGMVSREHARFTLGQGQVHVEDLGSTNGTFVNGTRIKKLRLLKVGDRVLFGSNIVKLVGLDPHDVAGPPSPRTEALLHVTTPGLRGSLTGTSVAEQLKRMADENIDGTLKVTAYGCTGWVHVRHRTVRGASVDRLPEASSFKALLRVVSWLDGNYEIEPFTATTGLINDTNYPVAELVVDALFKIDEWEVLRQRLPARVGLARPLRSPLSDLGDEELDLIQAAHNHQEVSTIVDQLPSADYQIATLLLDMLDAGYLRPLNED